MHYLQHSLACCFSETLKLLYNNFLLKKKNLRNFASEFQFRTLFKFSKISTANVVESFTQQNAH